NQTSVEFCECLTGNYGLRSLPLITTPNPVQFERRANPQSLDGRESLFTEITGRADSSLEILNFPRQFFECFALGRKHRIHIIVKAGNRNPKILVMQLGK